MPMCQSPKIVNVLVQARTLPANDNNLLIEARTRSFQAKAPSRRLGSHFLASSVSARYTTFKRWLARLRRPHRGAH